MRENEVAAHALVARLSSVGVDARVTGAGANCQVEVAPVGSRRMRVHCFWYERAITGLLLGINPANSRSRLPGSRVSYEGSEYLVILYGDDVRITDGRTRIAADVVACARGWLAGVELDRLVSEVPFIDEKPRTMRALAERLDPRLRREIGEEPAYALWVYGDGRSCEVMAGGGGTMACRFLLGQAPVAHAAYVSDVPAAVAAWLVARVPVRQLAAWVPGVELERHADVLDSNPARWHWLHVRDRIADPDDILAPLRELMQALAASPVTTRFYSYSSLNRLCFSASSHFPWVDDGLPVVAPAGDGAYLVGSTRCDLARAIEMIEMTLGDYPVQPFFGSAPHHELPLLSECLARQGSALRPQVVQHASWYELEVANAGRYCRITGRSVVFTEANRQLYASWPTLDDAVRAIRRFLEDRVSFEEIAADPRAQVV
jgi:hypothetical protein